MRTSFMYIPATDTLPDVPDHSLYLTLSGPRSEVGVSTAWFYVLPLHPWTTYCVDYTTQRSAVDRKQVYRATWRYTPAHKTYFKAHPDTLS